MPTPIRCRRAAAWGADDLAVDLVSVTPAAHIKYLMRCGFKEAGGVRTKYTVTLYRRYTDMDLAVSDAYRLPNACIWGIEEVAQ